MNGCPEVDQKVIANRRVILYPMLPGVVRLRTSCHQLLELRILVKPLEDFLTDEEKRKVSKPVVKSVGAINFVESDVSYYDKDAEAEIYYFTGIVETPSAFYKFLCWTTLANKDKFKDEFQKIFYSLRD